MRNIKFRARFKGTNDWVVLSLAKTGDMFPALVKIGRDEWQQEDGSILDVLVQFTGLKDKNGKEICESDLVEFHAFVEGGGLGGSVEVDHFGKGEVIYRPDGMTFVINDGKRDWLVEDTSNYGEPCFEIIGNIYENKELLK